MSTFINDFNKVRDTQGEKNLYARDVEAQCMNQVGAWNIYCSTTDTRMFWIRNKKNLFFNFPFIKITGV